MTATLPEKCLDDIQGHLREIKKLIAKLPTHEEIFGRIDASIARMDAEDRSREARRYLLSDTERRF